MFTQFKLIVFGMFLSRQKYGNALDFLLSPTRDAEALEAIKEPG